jgi:hypothetical protein
MSTYIKIPHIVLAKIRDEKNEVIVYDATLTECGICECKWEDCSKTYTREKLIKEYPNIDRLIRRVTLLNKKLRKLSREEVVNFYYGYED